MTTTVHVTFGPPLTSPEKFSAGTYAETLDAVERAYAARGGRGLCRVRLEQDDGTLTPSFYLDELKLEGVWVKPTPFMLDRALARQNLIELIANG